MRFCPADAPGGSWADFAPFHPCGAAVGVAGANLATAFAALLAATALKPAVGSERLEARQRNVCAVLCGAAALVHAAAAVRFEVLGKSDGEPVGYAVLSDALSAGALAALMAVALASRRAARGLRAALLSAAICAAWRLRYDARLHGLALEGGAEALRLGAGGTSLGAAALALVLVAWPRRGARGELEEPLLDGGGGECPARRKYQLRGDDDDDEDEWDAHDRSIWEVIYKSLHRDELMGGADLLRLVSFNSPNAGLMLASALCLLLNVGCSLSLPTIANEVVSAIIITPDHHTFVTWVPWMFVQAGTTAIFSGLQTTVTSYANNRMVLLMQKELFYGMLRQDMAFFDENSSGELISRLSSDTATVGQVVSASLLSFLQGSLTLAVCVVMQFWTNWRLAGVVSSLLVGFMLVCWIFGRVAELLSRKTQDDTSDMNHSAQESLNLIRTVRAFHAEEWAIAEYFGLSDKRLKLQDAQARSNGYSNFLATVFVMYMYTVALFCGKFYIDDGFLTAKQLLLFILYVGWAIGAVTQITSSYSSIMNACGAATKIFDLMDLKPEGPESQRVFQQTATSRPRRAGSDAATDASAASAAAPGVLVVPGGAASRASAAPPAGLRFDSVQFAYPKAPEKTVLRGMSFEVKAGEKLALVGRSGCGKSSCINLILRYYDPQGGAVMLDGVNIAEMPLSMLRTRMAVVLQETPVFSMTVRENILYPDVQASHEQVEAAAREARLHEFVAEMEKGYDTLVGDKGLKLSGGQKQRLALARALVRRPGLLLLDEATSALDAVTEGDVQDALNRLDVTSVVVAHRLSTIRNSNCIAVIDGGVVAERGTHDELCAKPEGHYATLVAKQREQATVDEIEGNAITPDEFSDAD